MGLYFGNSQSEPCVRPSGLTEYPLNYEYNGITFSGTLNDACYALNVLTNTGWTSSNYVFGASSGWTEGEIVLYDGIGVTTCKVYPIGFYILQDGIGGYSGPNKIIAIDSNGKLSYPTCP
jgi:hypothetical protein